MSSTSTDTTKANNKMEGLVVPVLRKERERWRVRVFILINFFMGVCIYVQMFEQRSFFSVQDRTSLKSFKSSDERTTTSSFTNKSPRSALSSSLDASDSSNESSTSLFTNNLSWSSLSSSFDTSNNASSVSQGEISLPRFYAPLLHHKYYSIIEPKAKRRTAAEKEAEFQDGRTSAADADMSRLRDPAKTFLLQRNEAYQTEKSLQTFKLRGIGYLYTVHKMILAAKVPDHPQLFKNNTIRIYNIYDGPILGVVDGGNNTTSHNNFTRHDSPRKDCHLFTIWVRVMGPELFAGTAQAIQPDDPTESCYWEFPFYLQVPGDYQAHAKSLLYDGYADRHMHKEGVQCETVVQGELRHDNETYKKLLKSYPLHAGFQGFKLYRAPGACCEVCSRLPDCRYWATPAFGIPSPSGVVNGCELFFEITAAGNNVVPDSKRIPEMIAEFQEQQQRKQQEEKQKLEQEQEKLKQQQGPQQQRRLQEQQHKILTWQQRRRLQPSAEHGRRHNFPTAYFVGCLWSYWFSLDFGCLSGELDDQVFMLNNKFTVLQLRNNDNDMIDTGGKEEGKHSLAMMNREVDQSLPLCELSKIKFNQNSGRWVRQDWPNSTMCPFPMTQADGNNKIPLTEHHGNHPRCWHRDNLNILKANCKEINCRFLREESYWRGPLQEEKEWFGVWRYNDCNLLEFTDPQIQQCINHHNISGFAKRGVSIADYIEDYVNNRLGNITLANTTINKHTVQVFYDTVAAPHIAWLNDEPKWRDNLEKMQPLSNFHYIVLPYYWASERESYVHVANAEKMAVLFEQILAPKGFRIINAFDLTKVFPYDTATQSDGLHVVGPPLKMIITIMIHDLCKDVVKGGTFV